MEFRTVFTIDEYPLKGELWEADDGYHWFDVVVKIGEDTWEHHDGQYRTLSEALRAIATVVERYEEES